MKVKLLKRLRSKAHKLWLNDSTDLVECKNFNTHITENINRNRLWYKLLTTLTHK
jgi:hypothetical protein